MTKINCDKRQSESGKNGEQHRCLHPKAQPYLEIVEVDQCMACPLRKPDVEPPKPQAGYDEPCEYRLGNQCVVTGLEITPEHCRRCFKESKEEEAKWSDKIGNYALAVRQWVAAGKPVRSKERIEEILENHCKKCRKYDPVKKGCKSCGCAINASVFPLGNKLAMATEGCPLGQFGPERNQKK